MNRETHGAVSILNYSHCTAEKVTLSALFPNEQCAAMVESYAHAQKIPCLGASPEYLGSPVVSNPSRHAQAPSSPCSCTFMSACLDFTANPSRIKSIEANQQVKYAIRQSKSTSMLLVHRHRMPLGDAINESNYNIFQSLEIPT